MALSVDYFPKNTISHRKTAKNSDICRSRKTVDIWQSMNICKICVKHANLPR